VAGPYLRQPGDLDTKTHRSWTFVPLFPGEDSEVVATWLRGVADPSAPCPARVVTMPVGGLAFFTAAGSFACELDLLWTEQVPAETRPVVMLAHEPGLEDYLGQLDAEFVVGLEGGDTDGTYTGFANVGVVAETDPRAIAEAAIRLWPGPRASCWKPGREQLGNPSAAGSVDPLAALASLGPLGEDRTPSQLSPPGRLFSLRSAPSASDGQRSWVERARSIVTRRAPVEIPDYLGDLLLGTRPPPLVVVGSRKGGVGKTALSAGLAQVYGYALDGRAGVAALVDQNINNADQWGRLMVPANAGTVREIMSCLENGQELPPAPAFARTPALAVYPESRELGDGYPLALVERFTHSLRRRHVVTVVDLPNSLPAYTSAEASVAAAYLDLADLAVVPTTDDPSSLRAALDYLAVPSMRGKVTVVPYIASPERGIREDPAVVDLLQQLQTQAAAVIPFPKTERATLAVVKGTSILEVDSRLRQAFIDLAGTVARILARKR
jgi:MinD-like ATPase involved in chromosome partitioning or flagellar assembly